MVNGDRINSKQIQTQESIWSASSSVYWGKLDWKKNGSNWSVNVLRLLHVTHFEFLPQSLFAMQHIKPAVERVSPGTKWSTIDFLSDFFLPFVSTGALKSAEHSVPLYCSERWDRSARWGRVNSSDSDRKHKHGSLFIVHGRGLK